MNPSNFVVIGQSRPDTVNLKDVYAVLRCMQQRLSSLHAETAGARSGHVPQQCEQAIAMATLACFIAHLTAGVPFSQSTRLST